LGGIQLAWLGGSWYYLLVGVGLALAGYWVFRRSIAGVWLYALIYLATIVWAIWEAGFEFWPLIPRLVAPTVLAILVALSVPLFPSWRSGRKGAPFAIAGILALALVATAVYAFQPHEVIRKQLADAAPAADAGGQQTGSTDWRAYGRTPHGTRYAPISQINRDNVQSLEVAWTFRTGDIPTGGAEDQNTPLMVGDTLYTCSAHNIVHALDAESGKVRWKFDPKAKAPLWQRCRGVSYYEPQAVAATTAGACAARIVVTTIDARLIELDAKTGSPCADFGANGTVDLKHGMGEVKDGFYFQTSAPSARRQRRTTPPRSLPSISPPGVSAGNSRQCITTCGTMTFLRSRRSTMFRTARAAPYRP
jgi:quinate dehydrogenase (quinone)